MTPGTCVLLGLSLIAVTGCAGVDRVPARAAASPGQPEATTGLPQARASQDYTTVEAPRADTSGSAAPVASMPIEAAAPVLAAIEEAPAPAPAPAPMESPAPAPAPKATKAPPAKAPAQPTK